MKVTKFAVFLLSILFLSGFAVSASALTFSGDSFTYNFEGNALGEATVITGSFVEGGDTWTALGTGNEGLWNPGSAALDARSGNNVVYIQNGGSVSTRTNYQIESGTTYDVSFWVAGTYKNDPGNRAFVPDFFVRTAYGNTAVELNRYESSTDLKDGLGTWTEFSFSFDATADSVGQDLWFGFNAGYLPDGTIASGYNGTLVAFDDLTITKKALAPVPEPATMILVGTGLIGLAGYGRKRMKRNKK